MQRMKPKKMFQNENEVSEYAKKVFKQVDKRFIIPEEILEWGINEIVRCFLDARTEKSKQMIIMKISHTQGVIKAGIDICLGSSKIKWNKTQVVVICFLHDIGRFRQVLYNTFSDSDSIDHARVGADLFNDHNWIYLEKHNLNRAEIYEAIDRHSRRVYKGNNNYARLIRDADKLEILRNASKKFDDDYLPDGPASRMVLQQLNKKYLVDYKIVNTQIDFILVALSWPKDFWFKVTYELYKESGASEWMKKQVLDQDPRLKGVLRLLEKSFEHHIVNLR